MSAGPRARRLGLAILALYGSALETRAQMPPLPARPDAGQILRETAPPEPRPVPAPIELKAPPPIDTSAAAEEGGRLRITGFRFSGNESVASERLFAGIPELTLAIGGECSLGQLRNLAGHVTAYYRRHGYLVATAYIPPQDVDDGIVTITVLEGAVDRATITGEALPKGYSAERLQRFLDAALCGGNSPGCADAPVTAARVERALGILADLPGVGETTGTLAPGRRVGTSDLEVAATPGLPWQARLSVDDYGSRYTGRTRYNAGLLLNNPGGFGDQLNLDVTHSGRGLHYGALDYGIPLGYTGWRGGIALSSSTYRLGEPFDVTRSHGNAQTAALYTTTPLIRRDENNLYLYGRYRHSWLEDVVLDQSAKKREQAVPIGISGTALDGFAGGGFTSYDIGATWGRVLFDDPNPASLVVASRFAKLNYTASRDQTLARPGASRLSLFASWTGQQASDNLDSFEKLYLGGPGAVRAYPTGEAPGDSGDIATLELRWAFPLRIAGVALGELRIDAFRDQGWIKVNEEPWAGFTGPNRRMLAGYGLGLSLQRRDAYQFRLMWARRTHSSQPSTTDDDENRFWFVATMAF